jgi:fumarylacetoacetate (FAA) hydrolase
MRRAALRKSRALGWRRETRLAESGRNGRLVVVGRDLRWRAEAAGVALTLQDALDDWRRAEPPLRAIAEQLERGAGSRHPFDEKAAASPLPRAYQWVDGSAHLNRVELVRRARGAQMPPSFLSDPLLHQGGAYGFLAPWDQFTAR